MPSAPASPGPGPDEDPGRGSGVPRPGDEAAWRPVESIRDPRDAQAWLDSGLDEDEPPGPDEEYDDPGHPAMPWDLDVAAIWAETGELAAEDAADAENLARRGDLAALAAADAGTRGRRGPGQPGSARRVPGWSGSPAGGFGAGQPLDVAPGGPALLGFAERVAEDEERLGAAADDEIIGLICALDRAEASACSLRHAAVAELIRRRPEPGCAPEGPARMPECWEEFAADEVRWALAETRYEADAMLDLAYALEVKLPGTREAFRTGVLRRSKVEIIVRATRVLDPDEARAAEAMVLGRAGRLSPGGLRAAIARAVIEVAPGKARKRREEAGRDARVERWAEDSGNAALAGRELPPARVLAADQRITWWALQLKAAGLEGSTDELRARAYLDLLLDTDSRPTAPAAEAGASPAPPSPPSPSRPTGSLTPPGSGVIPAGFTGRNHLTIPLATLLELAGLAPTATARCHCAAAAPRPPACLLLSPQVSSRCPVHDRIPDHAPAGKITRRLSRPPEAGSC